MTLKFKMKTEEHARTIKDILKSMADMLDYITLKEVIGECGIPDTSNSKIDLTKDLDYRSVGWRWSDLRGQNCKVGKAKRTWYLYLCDPPLKVNSLTPDERVDQLINQDNEAETDPENKDTFEMTRDGVRIEMVSEEAKDKAILDYMFENVKEILANNRDWRRKCMIWKKSRKKDVAVEEWPCWFHCWSSNRIVKDDGTVVDQLLAVCEHQDGHVERINYDHIRFVEEWD